MGLHTPFEQYGLYASVAIFLKCSYVPARKAFFWKKMLNETDPHLQCIYEARSGLSEVELKGGLPFLRELERAPRRFALVPLTYCVFEAVHVLYRNLSEAFSK
jgi:hypothetical protein